MDDEPTENSASIRYLNDGEVTRKVAAAVRAMDAVIIEAINFAKEKGVPQGLIVGLLHGYAHAQTAEMMGESDG